MTRFLDNFNNYRIFGGYSTTRHYERMVTMTGFMSKLMRYILLVITSAVIAGAGAGKTTTVAAKVKYLVEKKGIDPKKILIISFTNKAVDELKERINQALHIDCPIATFHSTGVAIIKKQNEDKK